MIRITVGTLGESLEIFFIAAKSLLLKIHSCLYQQLQPERQISTIVLPKIKMLEDDPKKKSISNCEPPNLPTSPTAMLPKTPLAMRQALLHKCQHLLVWQNLVLEVLLLFDNIVLTMSGIGVDVEAHVA